MKHRLKAGLLAAVIGFSAQAADVGNTLPAIQLKDQFGKEQVLAASAKRLYFTHDMAGGKLLKAALGDHGQAILDAQQAVAITDVSAMPAMVRSIMALPAMKKRSYRIGVDDTGKLVADIPRQPDQVTVIDLEALKIVSVRYAADEKSLKAMVKP